MKTLSALVTAAIFALAAPVAASAPTPGGTAVAGTCPQGFLQLNSDDWDASKDRNGDLVVCVKWVGPGVVVVIDNRL
jgi:hypothetical protein